jgi:hypothetical protein
MGVKMAWYSIFFRNKKTLPNTPTNSNKLDELGDINLSIFDPKENIKEEISRLMKIQQITIDDDNIVSIHNKKLTAEESTTYREAIRVNLKLKPNVLPRTKDALQLYYQQNQQKSVSFRDQTSVDDENYRNFVKAHLTAGSIQIATDGKIKVTGGSPYIKAITDANGLHLPANNITAFLLHPANEHPLGKMPQLVVALLKNPIERANWEEMAKTNMKINKLISDIDDINKSNGTPVEKEKAISDLFNYKSKLVNNVYYPALNQDGTTTPETTTDPEIEQTLTTMLGAVINTVNLVDDREENCKQLNDKTFPKVHAIHYNKHHDVDVIKELRKDANAFTALDFDGTVFNGHSGGSKKQKIDGTCNPFVKNLVDLSNKGTIQFDHILMASNNSVNYTSDADPNLKAALHRTFKTDNDEKLLQERLEKFNNIRDQIGTKKDGKSFTFYDAVALVNPEPKVGPSILKKQQPPPIGSSPGITPARAQQQNAASRKVHNSQKETVLPTANTQPKKGPKNA